MLCPSVSLLSVLYQMGWQKFLFLHSYSIAFATKMMSSIYWNFSIMTIFVLKMLPLNKGSVGQQVVHEDLTSNKKWQDILYLGKKRIHRCFYLLFLVWEVHLLRLISLLEQFDKVPCACSLDFINYVKL